MTWGRPEAQAQLWSLVFAALTTEAAERTADQQAAVDVDERLVAGAGDRICGRVRRRE